MAQTVEQAALDAGGDKIISVTAGFTQSRSESAMVSTNGFEGHRHRTSFLCGASITARDEGDRRPQDQWWERRRYRGELGDRSEIGRHAVDLVLGRVGADKIPTAEFPLLVDNRSAGRLISFYKRALFGRNLQQKRSFLDGKLGERVASEVLTVIDDPLVVRGLSSRLYDAEGITARRMPIIDRGVLASYYIDSYYGRKLGMRATTGSASNLTFESSAVKSPDAWMNELGRGILVTGFLGGNSNSLTGDFSVGIQGFLFENGSIARPLAGMNIAGNHLEFWNRLIGTGDDPYPFSSTRTPTLVFDRMVIAGA